LFFLYFLPFCLCNLLYLMVILTFCLSVGVQGDLTESNASKQKSVAFGVAF